jgi:hypothetical protein
VQRRRRSVCPTRLPEYQIVAALISVYDQFDVVTLGESHERRVDSDLRVALVCHPDFAKKVRTIVVKFGSTTEQATLDRHTRGENVSRAQFERVWKTTSQFGDLMTELTEPDLQAHSVHIASLSAVKHLRRGDGCGSC